MQGDPIDRLLRRTFWRHKPEVDEAALWAAIKSEVPQKRRRLWPLWVLLSGFGMFMLLWPDQLQKDPLGPGFIHPVGEYSHSEVQASILKVNFADDTLKSSVAGNRGEPMVFLSLRPVSRAPQIDQTSDVQMSGGSYQLEQGRWRITKIPVLATREIPVVPFSRKSFKWPDPTPYTRLIPSLPVVALPTAGEARTSYLKTPAKPLPQVAGRWEIDVSGGLNYSVSRLSGPAAYVNSRLETETDAPGGQFSFLLGRRSTRGWRIAAGLSYSVFSQQFRYQYERDTIVEQERVTAFWVPLENDTVFFSEVQQVSQQVSRSIRHTNSYRLWDLPIQIDYQVTRGRWLLGLGGGAVINLKASSRGRMLDATGQVIDFNNKDENPFRSNWGISAFGTATLGWRYHPGGAVIVQPGARYIPGKALAKDAIGQQGFWSYWLQVGIRQRIW